MTPVPLELPLRPPEASELASLIFDQAEGKPLTDDLRNRIAARGSVLHLETIRPYFGSLERDPVHPSVYYLAVDGEKGEPLLLHLALATAPTSSIFYKPLLIGRMRRANGPEMIINAIPFAASNCDQIEMFSTLIDTSFLPRPSGLRTTITVESDHPAIELPAAFDAFRAVLRRTGRNLASMGIPEAHGSARDFYCAGLWAAIRGGWREGYNAAIEIAAPDNSLEAAREKIRQSANFSTFAADCRTLVHPEADLRHAAPWSDARVEEKFETCFAAGERGWILDEFERSFDAGDAVYKITAPEVLRLAVKFGRSLLMLEQLHELFRQARSFLKAARSFDFEILLEQDGAPTTPQELIFCLHWLKHRGHAAQLAAPCLAQLPVLAHQLKALAGIARHYQARLSIRSRPDHSPDVLDLIARATLGRVNYKLSGNVAEQAGDIDSLAAHLLG